MTDVFTIQRKSDCTSFEVLPDYMRLHARLNDGELVEAQDVLTGEQVFIFQEKSGKNVIAEAKHYTASKMAKFCKRMLVPILKETASAMALVAVYVLVLFELVAKEVISAEYGGYLLLLSGVLVAPFVLSTLEPLFGKRGSECVFQAKVATDSRRSLPPIPRESCH